MTMRWKVLLLLLLSAAPACGPELVGGSERGEVETVVTDDPGSDGPAEQRSAGPRTGGGAEAAAALVALEGSVSVDAAATIVTAGGVAIPVTGPDATASLALGSGDEAPLGRETVEAGSYPLVRVAFRRVEVTLAVPLPLPSGGEGSLSIAVDLSAGPLLLTVPVTVEVADDETTTLRVDLNSAAWLSQADPVTGIVSRGAFAAAVGVEAVAPR